MIYHVFAELSPHVVKINYKRNVLKIQLKLIKNMTIYVFLHQCCFKTPWIAYCVNSMLHEYGNMVAILKLLFQIKDFHLYCIYALNY